MRVKERRTLPGFAEQSNMLRTRNGGRRDDEEEEEEEDHGEEEEEHEEEEREEEERDPREYVSPKDVLRRVSERLALADERVTTREDGTFADKGEASERPTAEAMSRLDGELRRIVDSLKTTPQDDAKRQALMNKFKSMISTRFEGVRVAPFGSYVSALHSAGSDIDISLQIDKNGPWYDEREEAQARRSQRGGVRARRQQRQGRTKRAQLLRKVASELRYRSYRDVQLISKARVPLIKFKDPHTGVACDVCIENDGVYKSAVLGVVADIDQRYRDLVFLIKLWAKHYDVNNAMEGTFNSYSLCLLCMHHLQRRKIPILPPTMLLTIPRPDLIESEKRELKEHQNSEDDQFDTWKVSKARVVSDASRDVAAVKYRANKFVGYGKDNSETLAELFVSFFSQLCAIKDIFKNALNASTYHGTFVIGSSWQAFKYPLGVEDPFAAGDNVARAVQMRTRDYVLNAFPAACSEIHRMLHAKDNAAFMRSLISLLGDKSVPAEVFSRFAPPQAMSKMAAPPPGPRPTTGATQQLNQQSITPNAMMEMLMRQVPPPGASAEELLAMLSRQRQAQAEAQQRPQMSEQQLLLLQRQQEILRMEQAQMKMRQGDQGGQVPVATPIFSQQPARAMPPGFGASQQRPPQQQQQQPFAGALPPQQTGPSFGNGLGGGIFSSIASGGGGLFAEPPRPTQTDASHGGVDELSRSFFAGMSMMGDASRPPASPLFSIPPMQRHPGPQPVPGQQQQQPLPNARGASAAQSNEGSIPRTRSGAAIPKPRFG